MALPTSGPISLSDIQAEFGGTNPISLSEYYAGGSFVPAGTSGTNGAVPSSGTISLFNFYGTSKVVISISDLNVYVAGATSATARYTLTTAGTITTTDINIPTTNWVTPTSQAPNYEVFARLVSGQPLASGTLNTWLALTNARAWSQAVATVGAYRETTINLQIRKVSTTTVLGSANITLSADTT
jgi:hypothetical protein